MEQPLILQMQDITKSFPGVLALDNVTLEVHQGTIHSICGENGAGKSTFLRILNGLESYDSGSITLDQKPLDINTIHKTHAIGMIFQQFNLFEHVSVERNITLALEKVAGKYE